MPTLPRNIYPAVPSALALDVNGSNGRAKTEEVDADGDDQWGGSEGGTATNAAEMFSDSNGQNGTQTETRPARSEVQPDDGVMRISLGLIGDIEAGDLQAAANPDAAQTQIEIERFSGIRLDAHLSEKPGFLINAGGPVFGLDWAPQADDDRPAG